MRLIHGFCALMLISAPLQAQQSPATTTEPAPAMSPQEQLSYVIGMDVGQSLQSLQVDLEPEALTQAIRDVLTGAEPAIPAAEAAQIKQAFLQQRQQNEQASQGAAAQANLDQGQAFLAENATRDGVMTTDSGLQYQIISQGDGPVPSANNTVRVHYRGTLIDGTEFDSSYSRGEPAEFPVGGVIAGWTEALQMMPVGSNWKLFIPPQLAYGPRAVSNRIGPNSTLVFEIELLEIVQ